MNDEVAVVGITLEYHRSNDCGRYAKILLLILIGRKICETRNNQPSNHRGEESYNTYTTILHLLSTILSFSNQEHNQYLGLDVLVLVPLRKTSSSSGGICSSSSSSDIASSCNDSSSSKHAPSSSDPSSSSDNSSS